MAEHFKIGTRSLNFCRVFSKVFSQAWGTARKLAWITGKGVKVPLGVQYNIRRTSQKSSQIMGKLHSQGLPFWIFFVCTQRILHLAKSEQKVKILRHFQKRWQAWDIWEDLQRCMSRGRRSTRDILIRVLGGQGVDFRWFPGEGCNSEHQTCRFANVILRDRCSTSYDLASISWQAQYFRQMEWKNRKTHWYDSTFHFWRKSRRIASFLMLSTSKLQKVSQNCLVFNLVKVRKKTSRRIASFFDVVNFKNWGRLAE